MKCNQKSSRGGVQDILFPAEVMIITQGNNGSFSHQGVNALDLGGSGKFPMYAPFDVVCKYIDSESNGNAVVWQSCDKVRFANGRIDYATIMIIHDNELSGISIGITYRQGMQIANAGNAGRATGIHSHFEIAPGAYRKPYEQNSQGVWHLPGSISADEACFVNGTIIQAGDGMDWKTI